MILIFFQFYFIFYAFNNIWLYVREIIYLR